jgi:hypothetical protein
MSVVEIASLINPQPNICGPDGGNFANLCVFWLYIPHGV